MLGRKFYSKNAANKWWDKYSKEDNVLIEDMDKTHAYQGFYLKIWADKYAFPVEIKNGGDVIRPKIIIVTSNYPIQEVFPDPEIHEPLLQRFKVIHKAQKWDAVVNNTLIKQPVKAFNTKKIGNKKRKFDKPMKKPALYKQNAAGQIVPNNDRQMIIDEHVPKLSETQEIAKEKEVIDLISQEEDMDIIEKICSDVCFECQRNIIHCDCFEDSMDDKIDSACFSDESDDCSDDLFDI